MSKLQSFYTRPLGLAVRRLLSHRIRARWQCVNDKTLIGLGFAVPFLGTFIGKVLRVYAMMPAKQGTLVWPKVGATRCVMVEETHLPLHDNSVDRLLLVHCLEYSDTRKKLLREIWRVLSPEGCLMLIVPNQRGVWAMTNATPFGYGRAYSRIELQGLLQNSLFAPISWTWALYFPPVEHQIFLKSTVAFERYGAQVLPGLGGIIIVEARKELAAPKMFALQDSARPLRPLGNLVTG
ncbi:MAG: methyltransferase domain-containing protein [Hyphomicrobiaceae bacterium]|nr:methyltransferase domain-containing protein [Hyphomicrobiaceae bacterium]